MPTRRHWIRPVAKSCEKRAPIARSGRAERQFRAVASGQNTKMSTSQQMPGARASRRSADTSGHDGPSAGEDAVMSRRVSISAMLGAVALCTFSGCSGHECHEMSDLSNVRIEVPEGWSVTQFCVDAACLDATAAVPNGVGVDDKPGTHVYRLTVVAPGGSETKRPTAKATSTLKSPRERTRMRSCNGQRHARRRSRRDDHRRASLTNADRR